MGDDDVLDAGGDPSDHDDERRLGDDLDHGVGDRSADHANHGLDGLDGGDHGLDGGADVDQLGDEPDDRHRHDHPDLGGHHAPGEHWADPDHVGGTGAWWDEPGEQASADTVLPRLADDPTWGFGGHDDVAVVLAGSSAAELLGSFEDARAHAPTGAVEALHAAWEADTANSELGSIHEYVTPDALGDTE